MYLTEFIAPKPWLVAPRPGSIKGVVLHATRGGTSSSGWEYIATKNWFQSPNNPGSCANCIIGPNGELCVVMKDSEMPQWSAGYGGIGPPQEFAIDHYFKSYEIAQPNNDYPFTDHQYKRLAMEIKIDMAAHKFPAVFVDFRASQTTPTPGITRHDRTANGVKLGKSDPGKMFDEARLLALISPPEPPAEEDEVPTQAEWDAVKGDVAEIKKYVEADNDIFIHPEGRPEVYRIDENRQVLVHAVNWKTYVAQTPFKGKALPVDHPIWKLRAEYPAGVPPELLS